MSSESESEGDSKVESTTTTTTSIVSIVAVADAPSVVIPEKPKEIIHDDEKLNAPPMNPLQVFWLFLNFGIRAFGGPVAQINMMREELVEKEKWITQVKFNRVLAVYQILPGPEATEMACYFGLIAGGRSGAVMGGLGFILPGLLLMLLFSWLYTKFGIQNVLFQAIFSAVQPAVCAMMFRAAHKIGEAGTKNPITKQFDWNLGLLAVMGAFQSVIQVNFFITKAHLALLYIALKNKYLYLGYAIAILPTAAYLIAIGLKGPMESLVPMGVGVAERLGNTYAAHFVVGLIGGLVTFGGAYTAVPFMQYECVNGGKWIKNQVFLDSLAIGSLLPSPMVMFVTLVGFVAGSEESANLGPAGGLVAALLMTLGMFLPAFIMPCLFHNFFEGIAKSRGVVADILDSMTATVVGLVAYTGCQLMRSSVTRPIDAIIFIMSLNTLYTVPHKYTPVFVVLSAALAGVVLFG